MTPLDPDAERELGHLKERIEDAENEIVPLRGLLYRVVGLEKLLESQHEETQRRFDKIDADHATAASRAKRVDWPTVLAACSGVVVPIVVAYMLAPK